MKLIIRWTFLSALALTSLLFFGYCGVVTHARAEVGHLMGRGPSVSECVDLYVGALSLGPAWLVGLLALAGTAAYWLAELRSMPELEDSSGHQRSVKVSLIAMPLACSIAYMQTFMVVGFFTWGPVDCL